MTYFIDRVTRLHDDRRTSIGWRVMVKALSAPEPLDQQRRQIMTAAIELFGSRGYHGTTMRAIAIHARSNIAALSRYARTKEEMLYLALRHVIDSHADALRAAAMQAADPLGRLRSVVSAYCRAIDEDPDALLFVYREAKSLRADKREALRERERETNRCLHECIDDCIAAGVFHPLDRDMYAHQLLLFCRGRAVYPGQFGSAMSLQTYVERGLATLLAAAMTAK